MKASIALITLLFSSSCLGGQESWAAYSDGGWKANFRVDAGSSSSRVTGWLVNRSGARCDVLHGQYLRGDVVGAKNFHGQIATTCGVLDVWKGVRSLPHTVAFTTGDRPHPFGVLFSGKATFD